MNTHNTINFISKYLFVLGVLQLIGLNLAGFFWFSFAKGIKECRETSRRWVFFVHGIYLIVAIAFIIWGLFEPSFLSQINYYNKAFVVPSWIGFFFIAFVFLVYYFPLVLLSRTDVKEAFSKNKN